LIIHFNSILPLCLYVPSGLFPPVVLTKSQCAPLLSPIHVTSLFSSGTILLWLQTVKLMNRNIKQHFLI
jgi:hypothetical protein